MDRTGRHRPRDPSSNECIVQGRTFGGTSVGDELTLHQPYYTIILLDNTALFFAEFFPNLGFSSDYLYSIYHYSYRETIVQRVNIWKGPGWVRSASDLCVNESKIRVQVHAAHGCVARPKPTFTVYYHENIFKLRTSKSLRRY